MSVLFSSFLLFFFFFFFFFFFLFFFFFFFFSPLPPFVVVVKAVSTVGRWKEDVCGGVVEHSWTLEWHEKCRERRNAVDGVGGAVAAG